MSFELRDEGVCVLMFCTLQVLRTRHRQPFGGIYFYELNRAPETETDEIMVELAYR